MHCHGLSLRAPGPNPQNPLSPLPARAPSPSPSSIGSRRISTIPGRWSHSGPVINPATVLELPGGKRASQGNGRGRSGSPRAGNGELSPGSDPSDGAGARNANHASW